jgi:peptide/nickel transport system substrate-binding protein
MKLPGILFAALFAFTALNTPSSGLVLKAATEEISAKKAVAGYDPVAGKPGGIRTFSIYTAPKSFNIYLNQETPVNDILNMMYDGLVSTNPVTLDIVPALAESWEISEDKTEYILKLRDDLKWSDGIALTADDVIFTFNEIISNPDIPNIYRDNLLTGEEMPVAEKIDELHIRFITAAPYVPFLRKLDFPVLPWHILADAGKRNQEGEILLNSWARLDSSSSSLVCNGPFKLEGYIPGKEITLTRNNNYWKKDAMGQPLPYLDKVKIEINEDPVEEYKKFMSGEIDSLWITSKLGRLLKPKEKELNFTIHILEQTSGSLFIMFNLSTAKDPEGKQIVDPVKSAWFRNPKFRKALAYALDKKEIVKDIYNGFAMPQYSSFSQNNPFYNPEVQKYRVDLEKASQLLKEAGFSKDKKGQLTDAKGNRVEFDLLTNMGNSVRDKTSKLIVEDWKKLGIRVNYKTARFDDMMKQIDEKVNWDSMLMGVTGSNSEPNDAINTWNLTGPMHMFNIGNSDKNPHWMGRETSYEKWETDLQNLYEKASQEFDPVKRKELFFKAQEIESEYLPFIYTAQPIPLVAVRNNIGNIFPSVNGGSGLNAVNWNIEEQFIKQ